MAEAPHALFVGINVVLLAKLVHSLIVVCYVVALEGSKVIANAVELNDCVKNHCNIGAVVTADTRQGNKSFLLSTCGVNPVRVDTKQRLIICC